MRSIKIGSESVAATSLSTLADGIVKEVGSCHLGDLTAKVNGIRDVVFVAGAPPIKVARGLRRKQTLF
jgi:hypothetical protein